MSCGEVSSPPQEVGSPCPYLRPLFLGPAATFPRPEGVRRSHGHCGSRSRVTGEQERPDSRAVPV